MTRTQRETKQTVAKWVTGKWRALVLASVLVALVVSLALFLPRVGMIVPISIVLSALLVSCAALIIALMKMIELLKAIRSELVIIRAHVDTGLLDDIATDLTAVRTQMGKGVFGLLGI